MPSLVMTYRLVAISLIVVLFSIINSSIYKIGLVSFLLIIRSVNFAKSFRTFPIAVKHGFYFCLSYKISIIKYVPSWIKCPNFLTNSIFIDNDYLCDILSFSIPQKNENLKLIIERITYSKTKRSNWRVDEEDDLELHIDLKL